MAFADDFVDIFSSSPSTREEVDLPMPGKTAKPAPPNHEVKYGVFEIGPRGNVDLEKIMSDCANGKLLLGWEKVNTTKEGDTQVIIKYMIPGVPKKKEPPDSDEEDT